MTLSSRDLAAFEAASRALASPLAAADAATWLLEAGAAVRDLVGGAGVVVQLPEGPAPFASADAPEVVDGLGEMVEAVLADGVRFADPVTDLWNRLRREQGVRAFSWDRNRAMVEARGVSIDRGLLIDQLRRQGYHDFVGLMDRAASGEAMVWVLGRAHGAFPFGDDTPALLGALLPSFRAGLDALGRLGASRAALDAVGQPLAVFDADGRELHRTPALAAVLAADPAGAAVEGAIRRLGAGAGVPPPAEATVRTARGAYVLRATGLPPGAFGPDPSRLVTVAAPARPLPTAEAVRRRYGLTRREAEVALLLAEGLSNAALADRLVVSPHTARHHVESVLAKLDLTSRAAVATRLLAA